VGLVELLGGCELPQDRAEPGPELGDAGLQEALDGFAGLRELAAVDGIARPLDREHEALRRLRAPLGKGCRRLRAVEGAVDLDRREALAGVLELARMRQPLGI